MEELDLLDDINNYRRLFTSVEFWEPYVKEVCRRQNLIPDGPVRIGVPGTCPTFITAERWVIKFFGRLFEGGTAFAVEREAGRLTDSQGREYSYDENGRLLGPHGFPLPTPPSDEPDAVTVVIVRRAGARADP